MGPFSSTQVNGKYMYLHAQKNSRYNTALYFLWYGCSGGWEGWMRMGDIDGMRIWRRSGIYGWSGILEWVARIDVYQVGDMDKGWRIWHFWNGGVCTDERVGLEIGGTIPFTTYGYFKKIKSCGRKTLWELIVTGATLLFSTTFSSC